MLHNLAASNLVETSRNRQPAGVAPLHGRFAEARMQSRDWRTRGSNDKRSARTDAAHFEVV